MASYKYNGVMKIVQVRSWENAQRSRIAKVVKMLRINVLVQLRAQEVRKSFNKISKIEGVKG
ncbi:MAG: hypothetical protein ACW98J_06080, partial [Candidatus Thorarchaeota archaeon]